MLTKWSVSNFKSIRTTRVVNSDETTSDELIFKPLTIFCGANSSGKSSLLQSILLLAQTMRFEDKKYPLILNGVYTSLGRFEDIISKPGSDKTLSVKFTISNTNKNLFTYNDYPFWLFTTNTTLLPKFDEIGFRADFCQGKKSDIFPELSGFEFTAFPLEKYKYSFSMEKKNSKFETNDKLESSDGTRIQRKGIISYKVSNDLNHFLPENNFHFIGLEALAERLLYNIFSFPDGNKYFHYTSDEINKIIGPSYFTENISVEIYNYLKSIILPELSGIDYLWNIAREEHYGKIMYSLDDWKRNLADLTSNNRIEVKSRLENNFSDIFKKLKNDLLLLNDFFREEIKNMGTDFYSKIPFSSFDRDLSRFIATINSNIPDLSSAAQLFACITDYFIKDIHYLGPLREDPKFLYPFSDNKYTLEIGRIGENTASTLALYGKESYNYPIPEWDDNGNVKFEYLCLINAVKEWLIYLCVAVDLKVNIEKNGYSLKVKSSYDSDFTDLNNVGVGVSQVLPIIVKCLSITDRFSSLIIEHPELHLHPKIQTRLANFLTAISQSGTQIIIESHSEHFINAFRYRIAVMQSPDDENLANNVQIYFTEKDNEGTLFKSITIDKYADVSDWPKDFFDEWKIIAIETLRSVYKKIKEDSPNE